MKRLALLILLLTSCVWTETEYDPVQTDTIIVKKQKALPQSIQNDNDRVPITFNPTLEDWKDTTITITPSGKL